MINVIKWFANAFVESRNNRLSLSRVMFFISTMLANVMWFLQIPVTLYHFAFITISLLYILFKDKAIGIIEKAIDAIVAIRTGNSNQSDNKDN